MSVLLLGIVIYYYCYYYYHHHHYNYYLIRFNLPHTMSVCISHFIDLIRLIHQNGTSGLAKGTASWICNQGIWVFKESILFV
jgi:hypothetical protein